MAVEEPLRHIVLFLRTYTHHTSIVALISVSHPIQMKRGDLEMMIRNNYTIMGKGGGRDISESEWHLKNEVLCDYDLGCRTCQSDIRSIYSIRRLQLRSSYNANPLPPLDHLYISRASLLALDSSTSLGTIFVTLFSVLLNTLRKLL